VQLKKKEEGRRRRKRGEMNSKHPLNPENKATGINWFNSSFFAQHSKPSLRNQTCLSHARAQRLSKVEVTHLFNNLQGSMKELLFSVNLKMCTECSVTNDIPE
jgi:hypothetical protein